MLYSQLTGRYNQRQNVDCNAALRVIIKTKLKTPRQITIAEVRTRTHTHTDHHRWSTHTHTSTAYHHRKQHSVECKPTPYHTKMSYGEQQAHWPEFSYRRATEFSCTALHYRWFFQLQFYLWHQPISGLSITLTLTHSSNCNLPKFYPWLIIDEVSKFHDNPPITFSQTHKQTQVNTSPPSKDAEATNLLNKTSMSNHFHLLSYQKHNGE